MIAMLPFVAWSAAGLLAALFLFGRTRPMATTAVELPPRSGKIAIAGAICFALVLLEIARIVNGWPAAIAAAICAAVFLRRRAFDVDYSIIPLFFFAFIIVEGLRSMNLYRSAAHLYGQSIALSQILSNVPATVLLSPMAGGRWRELLYGVNAGGCGTIIASLANLLGWRIYVRESNRDPCFFRRLTVINFAFLLWIAIGGWLILSALPSDSGPAMHETHRPVSSSASSPRLRLPTRARIRVAPSAPLRSNPSLD